MEIEGLSTVCAGLGIAQEDENGVPTGYIKSECCLENLKDLQRFLRRDNPQTRDVFKQVCRWNTVSHDLRPIIEHYQDDRDLVITAVKVLVFLTMPIDPTSDDIAQQIEYLWILKESVTRNDVIAVIVSLLEDPLEHLEREAFTEDDWKLVQLVLTLFRNLLGVQDISLQQKASGSANKFVCLRDRFLEFLFSENVMDLILVLIQHVAGSHGYLRQDNLLLLETLHYIFLGQDPELIAKAPQRGSKYIVLDSYLGNPRDIKVLISITELTSKKIRYIFIFDPFQLDPSHSQQDTGDTATSLNSLRSIMEEEEEKRRQTRQQKLDRYSHFSGTFVRFAVDGSKVLFKGNPGAGPTESLLKAHNVQRGPLKRTVWENGSLALSKENILGLLHDFANQFLSAGYSILLQSIRNDIEKDHHAIQSSDVVIFFQVAHFFIAFQRNKFSISKHATMGTEASEVSANDHVDSTQLHRDICGPIAATMNEAMFLLVISKWRYAFDSLKETNDYKLLSAAGSLMKEMIHMLDLVLKLFPEDKKESHTARILLYKIFYDQTDQGLTQFLVSLIKSFDTHKQPKSDLVDLVEMIHIVLRLMENLQARGALRVSKKSRKWRKMKTLGDDKARKIEGLSEDHVSLNSADELNNGVVDPNSKPSVNGNRSEKEFCQSSSPNMGESSAMPDLIWENEMVLPDTANLGDLGENSLTSNLVGEHEIPLIGTANLGDLGESCSRPNLVGEHEMPLPVNRGDDLAEMGNKNCSNGPDNQAYGSDESCKDDEQSTVDEIDLNVSKLVATFASNTVIHNLCWLLSFYKSNSASTNHYIICMLRRICDDLELFPMLYQLSLLTTFYDILVDQKSFRFEEYKNIVSFLTKLVRKLLRKMKSQPLLFVEILFWKTPKECHCINSDFLLKELGNLKKEVRKWGSVAVDGRGGEICPMEGKEEPSRKSMADALGEDEADFMTSYEVNYNKEEDFSGRNLQKVLRKDENDVGIMKKRSASISKNMNSDKENHPEKGHSLEHEFHRAPKRRKQLVFDHEKETTLRSLYEKYKESRQCSHLIAEALDPDGNVSPVQVSSMLKQLGLKVASKRRKTKGDELSPGGDGEIRDENPAPTSDITSKDLNKLEDDSCMKISSRPRKRIRVFSKEQEQRIKELFEQFKNYKRCSQLIADALDTSSVFSAAQISRKLKQLGLQISQQKGSHKATQSSDDKVVEDLVSAEREEKSEEETLLAVMRRSKSKVTGRKETARASKSKAKLKRSATRKEDSDDEILNSILLKNSKKLLGKPKDDMLMMGLDQESAIDNVVATGVPNVIESDACVPGDEEAPSQTLSHVVRPSNESAGMDDDLDAKLASISSVKQTGGPGTGHVTLSNDDIPLPRQQVDDKVADELADSDDARTVVLKNTGSRRKFKIDFEDDE